MADILASVSVVLGMEASGFKAGVANARKELKGLVQFSEGLKSTGEALTKYVTLPVLAVGGAAVKMAGDLEKAQASFKTMLGSASAATATLADLKKFAADTPFEFPEIQAAAKKLLAFNTPAAELKETLRELGDVSSGIDAPIGEIADLFGKARVQGRLFQEDINQLTGRGIPIIQELAKQFGVTENKVRDLVTKGKVNFSNLQRAFEDLTKAGGKFGGLMEEQSQTLPGLFSTLSDNVGQALADLGTELVKDLDLKGVLKELSGDVQAAADAFRALSPETKSFIIALAGVAAAAGPVLVAAGALGTLIPGIIASFTLLTGPVGLAAAAFVALGVGTAAYVSQSRSATQVFQEQRNRVEELERAVVPLADRYDFLKGKTTLNKTEQEELRRIIQQLGQQLPDTITQFDGYGRALSINTDKVRDFAEQSRRALTQKNKQALTEQREEYARLTREIDATAAALKRRNAAGDLVEVRLVDDPNSSRDFAKRLEEVRLTGDEIAALQTKLANLREGRKNVGALIDDLKGVRPPLVEASDAAAAAAGKLTVLSDAQQKALEAVQKSLRIVANESLALGNQYDYLKNRQSATEAGVKTLISAGFSPASVAVQSLVADLRNLNTTLGDNEQLATRVVKGLEKMNELPEFKLKVPEIPKLPTSLTPNLNGDFSPDAETLAANYDRFNAAAQAGQNTFTQAQANFNSQAEALIAAFPAEALGNVGASIGNALATGSDVLEAAGKALLKSLADLGGQLGQYLIKLGAANLVIPGAQGLGAAQIIAGGALVIAAGALGGFASSGGSGGGAAVGGRINTSPASAPRSQALAAAPSAASGGAAPTTITHVVKFSLTGRELTGALTLELDRLGRIRGR